MKSLYTYTSPPSTCGYLSDRDWQLEYELVAELTAAEYEVRLQRGWRHFGGMLFRPRCQDCVACQSLRIDAVNFTPNRSQKRAWKANIDKVQLRIGKPKITETKLRLYDRFHEFQAEHKGWPDRPARDAQSYASSFVDNPFAVQEWCYYLGQKLIGVGYVDELPTGFSAIYFFYDPDERDRSLGTWNVLSLLARAKSLQLPYLYLGYFVEGCPSLAYKATFRPNEVYDWQGNWGAFRTV